MTIRFHFPIENYHQRLKFQTELKVLKSKVRPERKSSRVVAIQYKLLQRVAHRPVMQKKY